MQINSIVHGDGPLISLGNRLFIAFYYYFSLHYLKKDEKFYIP